MKNIFIGFIVLGFLAILAKLFYNAVEETVEVTQYAPHIMETSPGIDFSDTMVFYNDSL